MLRYFDARLMLTRLRASGEGQGGPEIAFPVDTIALVRQGQTLKTLPLDADGGALPLL
jgi:hypothetical protein